MKKSTQKAYNILPALSSFDELVKDKLLFDNICGSPLGCSGSQENPEYKNRLSPGWETNLPTTDRELQSANGCFDAFYAMTGTKPSMTSIGFQEFKYSHRRELDDNRTKANLLYGRYSNLFTVRSSVSFEKTISTKDIKNPSEDFMLASQIQCIDDMEFISTDMDKAPILLYVTNTRLIFVFNYRSKSIVDRLMTDMIHNVGSYRVPHKMPPTETGYVDFITTTDMGLDLKRFEINSVCQDDSMAEDYDFFDNYPEDFKPAFDKIVKALSQSRGKGVVLFHGVPGTGKTSAIRYLIKSLVNQKSVTYLPNTMTEALTNPGLITFLMEYPNRVLVIEDAETVLRKRTETQHVSSAVSNLLNMSDGILSDVLSNQIVATFNCELAEIDPAFLRKGRLICQYEFKPLMFDRIDNLCNNYKTSRQEILDFLKTEDSEFYNRLVNYGDSGWPVADFYEAVRALRLARPLKDESEGEKPKRGRGRPKKAAPANDLQ